MGTFSLTRNYYYYA